MLAHLQGLAAFSAEPTSLSSPAQSTASPEGALRPAIAPAGSSANKSPETTSPPPVLDENAQPASWPPYDTLPLGVNQYQAPVTELGTGGPVGAVLGMSDEFIQNKPCKNCTAVKIKVQNFSAKPIIVDGERAQALKNGAVTSSLSEDDAMHSSGGQFTGKQKALLAVTAGVTLGFWEPILQDHYSTSKTDFPVSYGLNQNRRRLEDRRLSRRVVLPGEDTEGVIYFPGDTFSFDSLRIPLLTYPLGIPTGTLEIASTAPQIKTADTGVPPGPDAPLINKPYEPTVELYQRKRLREE